MEWTVRLEARTGWGEVETVELVSIARPVLAATADDVGLSLAEANSLMAKLQEAMVRGQVAEHLHCRRVCPSCLTFQRVQDRHHLPINVEVVKREQPNGHETHNERGAFRAPAQQCHERHDEMAQHQ